MQAPFSWVTFLAGLMSGFLPGLFSGYLLQRLKEKRDARLRLSENVYRPLYQQIYEAAQQIEQRKKAVSANARLWESIKSQGLTSEIEASLLKNLSELFYQVFPTYDAAWEEACNRKIPALLRDWDEKFGNPPGPRGVQYAELVDYRHRRKLSPSVYGTAARPKPAPSRPYHWLGYPRRKWLER